jgi:hypothetical protein
MGTHRSVRTNSGQRRGWRTAAIVGVGVGFAAATVAGIGLASGTTTPTPSVYSAITPVTVLGKSLAADSNTDVTVAGVGSVPSNATSVQLSVTALSGTTTSSMYVYATGATKPTSANVRWLTGETVTIPVTVAVGTSGRVRLTTDAGTVTIKVAVVGFFSPGGAGIAGYAAGHSHVAVTDTGGTIASLTVPAGTYEVQAKADMDLASGSSDEITCFLGDPASASIDSATLDIDTDSPDTPLVLVGLDTTSGGTMAFECEDSGSNATAFTVQLVAVQLGSASGEVAGG